MEKVLTPIGLEEWFNQLKLNYLEKDNYLSEYVSESEKSVVRLNLGILSKEETYDKESINALLKSYELNLLLKVFTKEDTITLINKSTQLLNSKELIKADGSIPFTNPPDILVLPKTPTQSANKGYVDTTINKHILLLDPHNIIPYIKSLLTKYVTFNNVYSKEEVYSKTDLSYVLSSYVSSSNGLFKTPVSGQDPTSPSHLTTARYVYQLLYDHSNDVNAHNILKRIKEALDTVYPKHKLYTKEQTFSREEVKNLLYKELAPLKKLETECTKIDSVKEELLSKLALYVKLDGSTIHTAPQKGKPAVELNEFVTLELLSNLTKLLNENLEKSIKFIKDKTTWITSGNILTTVGFMEDNSEVPEEMSLQEVCDSIFYGIRNKVEAPETASEGSEVCITIYVLNVKFLKSVSLYKTVDDKEILLKKIDAKEFILQRKGASYQYCDPDLFLKDTKWRAEYHYINDREITETANTKLARRVFVGAIPYWENVQEDLSYSRILKLCKDDKENNTILNVVNNPSLIIQHNYNFIDYNKRSFVLAVPFEFPDLDVIKTNLQTVTKEAFAKWTLPLFPGKDGIGLIYKIYVFNQPLIKVNQQVAYILK